MKYSKPNSEKKRQPRSLNLSKNKADKIILTKSTEFATKGDVANAKADIIKWMFIFWIGQVAVTIGLVSILFK